MIPATHTAAVFNGSGGVDVKKVAVPKAGENEVLVKLAAAALNPADSSIAKGSSLVGNVAGHDFAGVIAELGPGAESSGLTVGDRVAAYVPMGRATNGSFSEHVVSGAHFCIPLPESWTFELGAQVGVNANVAFQTLYQSLELPAPFSEGTPTPLPLLVYGASSAVGLYVVQIAKATGFKVFAICSPKNFELVKSLGADGTFDYRDPDVSKKIKEASDGKIKHAVDTISQHGSSKIIAGALSSEGGRIATLHTYTEEDNAALGPGVSAKFSGAYNIFRDSANGPSRLADGPKFAKLAARLLSEGKIKPMPIKVWENGLEGIGDAMQYMSDGKVSGEKIVFRIADTPGLA